MSDTENGEGPKRSLQFPELPAGATEPADPVHWKHSLVLNMDANRRMTIAALHVEHRTLALIKPPAPTVIPIPWHTLKEAVAQILTFELESMLEKLPPGARQDPKNWPQGARGVWKMGQLLMDSAMTEQAGYRATEDGQPHFKPNLNVILGGDGD